MLEKGGGNGVEGIKYNSIEEVLDCAAS